jgi:hypothetical protein
LAQDKKVGCAASGAKDANSFHAALRGRSCLPDTSSLTYQGLFNQHTFNTGPREKHATLAITSRALAAKAIPSWAGGDDEDSNGVRDVWVGCFLRSCRDGQPRDGTPIDIVAVLDISGSMSRPVGSGSDAKSRRCRLELANEALIALVAQLRDDDQFGLATFNTQGTVIRQLGSVRDLDRTLLANDINMLQAAGGTTMQAGMEAAMGICDGAASPTGPRHRRVLFLTDMEDLHGQELNIMIADQAKAGLYVSFIGIGMGFNSQLAEEVSKHPGANYFCITRDDELKKVVVDDFDWNFFPVAFEVELAQQSDALDLIEVYGTPFDTHEEAVQEEWQPDVHRFYPQEFKAQAKELILCTKRCRGALPTPALQSLFDFMSPSARTVIRVDTVFPSALKPDGSIEGGLILMRMRPRANVSHPGTVRLMLRYVADGSAFSGSEDLKVPVQGTEADVQFPLPDPAILKGVVLQRFVDVCRLYLSISHNPSLQNCSVHRDAALRRIDSFLAKLESGAEAADALCPGIRQELLDFASMARDFQT